MPSWKFLLLILGQASDLKGPLDSCKQVPRPLQIQRNGNVYQGLTLAFPLWAQPLASRDIMNALTPGTHKENIRVPTIQLIEINGNYVKGDGPSILRGIRGSQTFGEWPEGGSNKHVVMQKGCDCSSITKERKLLPRSDLFLPANFCSPARSLVDAPAAS